jgi:AcrR family transcriptional regulator
MARGFTDEERDRIYKELLAAGRELFTRYGLKKTTLRELTEPLGIAKSSFYIFFDSKEALYWELLLAEGPEIEARVRAAVDAAGDETREEIAALLRTLVHEIETNDLYRRLIDHPEELELVLRRLPPETTEAKLQGSLAMILTHVRRWQTQGALADDRPLVVASALRAVTLLTLHEDEIGREVYPDVMAMLIDAVAAGLASRA